MLSLNQLLQAVHLQEKKRKMQQIVRPGYLCCTQAASLLLSELTALQLSLFTTQQKLLCSKSRGSNKGHLEEKSYCKSIGI